MYAMSASVKNWTPVEPAGESEVSLQNGEAHLIDDAL
ncbi:hypothetical protein K239x_28750 [Planctomycetes bacterium K23_9]|uniref:Uncharacterized protein n=1 Tax=Stieleria marina TaxID=1930275 RepID=A0A517NUT6_9BACT|nr:hypothetical protein K239x_28750 [Planctomycetes bacterium K23_9]